MEKYLSANNYWAIDTIDKNPQSLYYTVKLTSASYTFQSYHKIGKYVNEDG